MKEFVQGQNPGFPAFEPLQRIKNENSGTVAAA
jgi:hypothetical protein